MIGLHLPQSLRGRLLLWIVGPVTAFIVIDTFALYGNALKAANAAYDRMLVTTAYSIGDALQIEDGKLRQPVSYATLEVYEPEYSTRMIYAVRSLEGRFMGGDADLARYVLPTAERLPTLPSLLHIYESNYGSARVRVVAVFQPLPPQAGLPGVVIQIAEPMENRTSVALGLLRDTLFRQAVLLAVVLGAVWLAVNQGLRPLCALAQQLDARNDADLTPVVDQTSTRELSQVVTSMNRLIGRIGNLLGRQQRFVSDASHQLRTPLAVLKAQAQSGLRGDAPPLTVLGEVAVTADRAANLADKMLSLAKVEQLLDRGLSKEPCDLNSIAQDVAVELSPLISEKNLDFSMDAGKHTVPGHPWMISELISNLVHNAIRHTPRGGQLGIRITETESKLVLTVWDAGSGISSDIRERLFEPFAATHDSRGCGLGLTICREIALSMDAQLTLDNRTEHGTVVGLDANLTLPKADLQHSRATTPH